MRQAEGYIFEIVLFCTFYNEVFSRHPNILTLLGKPFLTWERHLEWMSDWHIEHQSPADPEYGVSVLFKQVIPLNPPLEKGELTTYPPLY
jgi:hypothetical protein